MISNSLIGTLKALTTLLLLTFQSTYANHIPLGLRTREAFDRFEREFGRKYASRQEEEMRLRQFRKRYEEVKHHNKWQNSYYQMEINKFSDLTDTELDSYLGLGNVTEQMSQMEEVTTVHKRDEMSNMVELPDEVDHRTTGIVTPVKNQNACKSCWAFAAVGSIESAYKQETGYLKSFSEQELIDCMYEQQDHRDSCSSGGWYFTVYGYVKMRQRLATYNSYPYTGFDAKCNEDTLPPDGMKNARVTGYRVVKSNPSAVEEALRNRVLAVAIHASTMFGYRSGIFTGCPGPRKHANINHAVVLTGFTKEYWTIKNSWGIDWGEQGYLRLSRDRRQDSCKITRYPYYPVVQVVEGAEKEHDMDDIHEIVEMNVAHLRPAKQGPQRQLIWGDDYRAELATDGYTNRTLSPHHSSMVKMGYVAWWTVTLDRSYDVKRVEIYLPEVNQTTVPTYRPEGINGATVHVGDRGNWADTECGKVNYGSALNGMINVVCKSRNGEHFVGSKVTIDRFVINSEEQAPLVLSEVKVIAFHSDDCPPGNVRCLGDGVCRPHSFCNNG